MGTSASKNSGSCHGGREGQLYVSLKMENFKIRRDLIPHVYGSVPITGSWDFAKALSMARESASMWELSFVVSPDHGMREPPARLLDPIASGDHVFLLRFNAPCVVEEGPSRLLTGGTLEEGDARSALFKIGGDEEVLEYKVFIKADIVSPFDLAASWRAYQENLEPSRVRGIPDVSINVAPNTGSEVLLELRDVDLAHLTCVRSVVRPLTPPCLCQAGFPVSGQPRWRASCPRARGRGSQVNICRIIRPPQETFSRFPIRVLKMRSCAEPSVCGEVRLVNSGTNPGDLAERVNSGTNPGDLVEKVNSGTNPEDLAEKVNSGTNPGDLAEKVNSGINPGDLAER
ncbi:hypothetical protein B296_00028392, partial [Ensete ventricosum]